MSVRLSPSGPFAVPNDFVSFPASGVALLGSVDGGNTFSAVPADAVPGGLLVNTSAELAALVDVPIGALVYVRSRGRSFQFVPSGAGELPGVGGSWKSIPQTSSVAWLLQASWSVDAVNGNDDASGVDDAHALQTFAELYARLGGAAWIWSQSVTIRVLSDCDPIELDFTFATNGLTCDVVGVVPDVPELSGVVTSWTGLSGNVSARIQLDSVVDWTPWVNRRLRIVGGVRNGAVLWIAQASPNGVGAQIASTLQGAKPDGGYSTQPVAPVVGDVMVVDRLRSVARVKVTARSLDPVTSALTYQQIKFSNLNVDLFEYHGVSIARLGALLFGCYVHNIMSLVSPDMNGGQPFVRLSGCRLNPDTVTNIYTDTCLISLADRKLVSVRGHWVCGHDLVQGNYLAVNGADAFLEAGLGSFGIQEIVEAFGGGALRLQNGARASFASNFYGQSTAAIVGVNMGGGASLVWINALPSITGSLGDVRVNGLTAATRPIISWAATGGFWNDGMLQGTAQLGAGGFVDVTIPSWLSTQSIGAWYRTPGGAAGVLSVPLANRTAGGFRIVGSAADTTSTVDWFVGPLGAQQFIGKL